MNGLLSGLSNLKEIQDANSILIVNRQDTGILELCKMFFFEELVTLDKKNWHMVGIKQNLSTYI